MGSRRFTRLTNGFSKKPDNHVAAVALYVAHYNLCRTHEALRTTPAKALGVATPRLLLRPPCGLRPTAEHHANSENKLCHCQGDLCLTVDVSHRRSRRLICGEFITYSLLRLVLGDLSVPPAAKYFLGYVF